MKSAGTVSIRCLLLAAAWLGTSPVLAQQFLRAPALPAVGLVEAGQLTHTFAIDPNAFLFEFDDLLSNGKSVENKNIQERAQDYFAAAGIDLAGNNGPRFFFNERTGILTAQGTIAELETVEKAVHALTSKPSRVAIEVRFLESTGEMKLPALKALLTELETDNQDLPSTLPLQSPAPDAPGRLLRTAVLTQRESTDILRSAQQMTGVDTIIVPRTVTISGRQARIPVAEPSETIIDPPISGGRRIKLNAE